MRQGINRDAEIEQFKTGINLTEYAAHMGYEVERGTSSRHSITMRRRADDDKVIVARNSNQHWMYFSVRDDGDNGTIIDFHQRRTGQNLGHTRMALREFQGLEASHRPPVKAYASNVEPTLPRDQQALDSEFAATKDVTRLAYLNTDRAIGREVLASPRFTGKVLTDRRQHALFPHSDEQGRYSGSEIKGRGFTGFSPGGEKGLWLSNRTPDDKYLVICESAIDCLSHYALYQAKHAEVRNHTRYISTGGAWSPKTPALLKQIVEAHPGTHVVLAFDNDPQGQEYTSDATTLLSDIAHEHGKDVTVRLPSSHKDWNDQLVAARQHILYPSF